jgi:hypothetical protein
MPQLAYNCKLLDAILPKNYFSKMAKIDSVKIAYKCKK